MKEVVTWQSRCWVAYFVLLIVSDFEKESLKVCMWKLPLISGLFNSLIHDTFEGLVLLKRNNFNTFTSGAH